jgi:hypothetical protein
MRSMLSLTQIRVNVGVLQVQMMCISYLFYYPRQLIAFDTDAGPDQIQPFCGIGIEEFLPGCEAEHQVTPDFTRFEREDRDFGLYGGECAENSGTPSLYLGFTVFLVSLRLFYDY